MKKKIRKTAALVLAFVLVVMAMPAAARAKERTDAEAYKPFLALGADLKDSERATVLSLMGITEKDVAGYHVIEITNGQEKEYLGDYVDASVIGSRALSSVLVAKQQEGHGITVETRNINYCTEGMYRNALLTAGVENAKVIVAGPFELTGTAALVGALQAYSVMTGEEISEEQIDTAVNELVLTGRLAEKTGDSQGMEELIALVKQQVLENGLNSEEDIQNVIKEAAGKFDMELTEEQIGQIVGLMDKISKLDIDTEALKEQAGELYDRLKDLRLQIDKEGFMESFGNFFGNIVNAVAEFIAGFFKK